MKHPFPGLFITFEGIDGSGKSTLARALDQQLTAAGKRIVLTKEPGGTELGKTLRTILQTQQQPVCGVAEFLLFAADRAQHFNDIIIPALKRGDWIIGDRSADSSLAYQGFGRGINREHIARVNTWAMQNIEPDLTVYLRIDPATAAARYNARGQQLTAFEQEKIEFWQRVTAGYESIFDGQERVLALDGNQPTSILVQEVVSALKLRGNL